MQNVEKTVDTLQNVEYIIINLRNVGGETNGIVIETVEISKRAAACGVHRNTYAAWEENPDDISVGNAKIIAKALHESVDTIFFNNESTKCRK